MLPLSIGTMTAYLRLDYTRLQAGLQTAEKELTKFHKKIGEAGLTMVKIGGAVLAPLAAATKAFASFDDQMRLVKAVTQSTGESFRKLTYIAQYLGRTTTFTAVQVASAMVELGRAGFTAREIADSIGPILNLSRATGTDLAEAANMAASALRAFNLRSEEMPRIVDVMTAAANASAQTLYDLGESLKYAAPVAADFGMSIEETAKAISTMANFSIRGSMAGTSLRMVMLRLASTDVREKLEKLGVPIEKMGRMREVSEILQDIARQTQRMTTADRLALMGDLFGARAISGGLKLASANFERLNDAIDNAAGTAGRVAEEMEAGIGGAFKEFTSAMEGTTHAIGESFSPALRDALKALSDILNATTEIIKEHGVWARVIGEVASVLGILGGALLGVKSAIWVVSKAAAGLRWLVGFGGLTGLIIGVGAVALIAVVRAIRALTYHTAKYTDVATEALSKSEAARREDRERLKLLRALSQRQKLTSEEMKTASEAAAHLRRRYGELGISVDYAGRRVTVAANAFKRMNEAMKAAALAEVDAAIAEARRNIDELTAEMESVWFNTSKIKDLAEQREREQKRLIELGKKRRAIERGDERAVVGLGPKKLRDYTKAAEKAAAMERQANLETRQKIEEWDRRIAELRVELIEDETKRALEAIKLRYDEELRQAKNNADLAAKIQKARELEIQKVRQEAAARQKAEEEDRRNELLSWDQRIAMLRARQIEDEGKRRIAEIKTYYQYELERAKDNAKLRAKILEAARLEIGLARAEAAKGKKPSEDLPSLIEKGTAEAYAAIVGQEQDQVAKNTGTMVAEQRKTNRTLAKMERNGVPVLKLGIA